MNFYKIMILCFLLQFNTSCLFAGTVPNAKFEIKVEDEEEKGLANVKVEMYPMYYHENYTAMTDENGKCFFNVKTDPLGGFHVKEKGYYKTLYKYDFSQNANSYNKLLNRWEPYPSKIKLILRKKKNPVPMYAMKTGWIKVTEIGKPVGFDLEKGDWVKPHGKGEISDFVFTYKGQYKLQKDWKIAKAMLNITLPNPGNGIFEHDSQKYTDSAYIWPYKAPIDKYQPEIIKKTWYEKDTGRRDSNISDDRCYIFRVRTIKDDKGNIVSACYGKIIADFDLSYKGLIRFTYYFNPDPKSRSLEFDPDKNLFKKDKTHYQP